jgi:hypothetical protein
MTTIAWDEAGIAWDSLQTSESGIRYYTSDKVRVVDGIIYALAGNPRVFTALIDWVKAGAIPDDFPGDPGDVLAVLTKENTTTYAMGYPLTGPHKPGAIGTGGDLAYAVMSAGKSATEAVALVSQLDMYSGGETNYLEFASVIGPPKERRRAVKIVDMKATTAGS